MIHFVKYIMSILYHCLIIMHCRFLLLAIYSALLQSIDTFLFWIATSCNALLFCLPIVLYHAWTNVKCLSAGSANLDNAVVSCQGTLSGNAHPSEAMTSSKCFITSSSHASPNYGHSPGICNSWHSGIRGCQDLRLHINLDHS